MTDLSIKNLSYVDNFKHTIMGNYANFKGRASRSEYWRFYGITIVVAGIFNVLSALVMDTALASVVGLISIVYNLAFYCLPLVLLLVVYMTLVKVVGCF